MYLHMCIMSFQSNAICSIRGAQASYVYLQQLRATASLVTGLCLAAYFYPEPVCVLPIPYPTYNLPLIVCRLYTQRVPMHSYTYLY